MLNGDEDCDELGYISIQELTACGAELDLYFAPRTPAEVKAARGPTVSPSAPAKSFLWVLALNPGQSDQDIVCNFAAYEHAALAHQDLGVGEIMRRLDDGRLATEFCRSVPA